MHPEDINTFSRPLTIETAYEVRHEKLVGTCLTEALFNAFEKFGTEMTPTDVERMAQDRIALLNSLSQEERSSRKLAAAYDLGYAEWLGEWYGYSVKGITIESKEALQDLMVTRDTQ